MQPAGWWKGGVAAFGGAALALATMVGADAQAPVTLPMKVTQNRVPGATGQVTMTPLGNNQVRVDIRITGVPANGEHIAHIHGAAGAVCDNGSPAIYPLTTVRVDASGVGTSTTTVTLTADKPIQANNAYVNVHQNATPPAGGMGVICGDVTASFAAGAAAAQPTAQAPAGAPAKPTAQAPAGTPAKPTAQAPAGTSARPSAAALPRTGTGMQVDTSSSYVMLSGLALLAIALGGASLMAVRRRR